MSEHWLPIPGYEGLYLVSDLGRVQSVPRPRTRGGILATPPDDAGYPQVRLYAHGTGKTYRVHQLVALAFIGPCPEGQEVRHLDDNKERNALGNLTYGTRAENEKDKQRNGRCPALNKTHCPAGHPYDQDNTYVLPSRPNSRYCRACSRERQRQMVRHRK